MSAPHPSDPLTAADFGTLFEFLPIGAYRSLPDGRHLRANPALARLNGYASADEMYTALRDIATEWYVDPGRRAQFMNLLRTEGRISGFVSEVRRLKTGERIWVTENAQLVRDAQGELLFFEGTVEEVSERVAAERALRRSEEELRQIADRLPGVVFRTAPDASGARRMTFVSDGLRTVFGLEPQAVLAQPDLMRRHRHPEDAERVEQVLRDAWARGAPASVEFRIVRPDGRVRWVAMHSAPVRAEDGEQIRVGVVLDTTAQRESEAMRQQRDRAEAARQAMTQFLSRVSHELRTPLHAILGFAELVATEPETPARQREWMKLVRASGEHLLGLVDDILDLTGVQSGQLRCEIEDVELAPVVRECEQMVAASAAAMGVHVNLPAVALDGLVVRADRRRLRQVLANLLSNAIKYNRPAGHVTLAAHAQPPWVVISVADTGRGIPEDQRRLLFQPFERLGAQRSEIAGTGLGLALSQHLAHAMGGEITVRSTAGVGSTFTLCLPEALQPDEDG